MPDCRQVESVRRSQGHATTHQVQASQRSQPPRGVLSSDEKEVEVADPDDPKYPEQLVLPPPSVKRPQAITFPITTSSSGGANICCIYSGTLVFEFKGNSEGDWRKAKLYHQVPTEGRRWTTDANRGPGWTRLVDGSVVAAPAAMYNHRVANYAGWAVDAAWLEIAPGNPEFGTDEFLSLRGHIAVRDTDGYMFRIAYQAIALGRTL